MTHNAAKPTLPSVKPSMARGSDTPQLDTSTAQQALVQSCMEVIEEQHKGNLSTSQVALKLFSLLPEDMSQGVLAHYIDQLAEIECSHAVALQSGSLESPM